MRLKDFKLIIGLGNPGKEFKNNWHNIGFMFCDRLPKSYKTFKPMSYMNNSGYAIFGYLQTNNIDISEVLVVHDDLDLKFGRYKLQFTKGPKVHNGILSIESVFETKDFWRLRIGIDNRQDKTTGLDFVMRDLNGEEAKQLDDIFNQIIKHETIIR